MNGYRKPGTVYLVGILQILSGFMHAFAEPLLVGTLMFLAGAAGIGFLTTGRGDMMVMLMGLLLLALALLLFLVTLARFVLGVRMIIGAVNLMRGLRRKGYLRARSFARKDVWSFIFLNMFSVIVGIICWILLDSRGIRTYFSRRKPHGKR